MTLLLATVVTGCDFGWGGATISLVNPAPTPEPEPVETPTERQVTPLPQQDILYLVRFSEGGESVSLAAAAELTDGVPTTLAVPEVVDAEYRARFDSAFHAPGVELSLHAAGGRIGTVVLDGGTFSRGASCLSTATGTPLMPPGAATPEYAFAWGGPGGEAAVALHTDPAEDDRMRTFGPVLAENLLRQGGERRPYLAQRHELRAVAWQGDARPAMAATYLVNDDLEGDSPANAASSLFVLARFDPARGYQPEWWEVRRYGSGAEREAFVYLGSFTAAAGRVDVVRRVTETGTTLAASLDRDDRAIDWSEPAACSALSRVGPGAP